MTSWLPAWLGGTPSLQQQPSLSIRPAKSTMEIIDDIHTNKEALEFKRLELLSQIEDIEDEARQLHKKGKKQQAITLLKRRQIKQTQVTQLEGQITNLEQAGNAVESTAVSVDVAASMKDGSNAVKDLLQQVSIKDIADTADELAQHINETGDIMDALAQPMGISEAIDEDDMEATLAEWDQEEQEKLDGILLEKQQETKLSPPVATTTTAATEPEQLL